MLYVIFIKCADGDYYVCGYVGEASRCLGAAHGAVVTCPSYGLLWPSVSAIRTSIRNRRPAPARHLDTDVCHIYRTQIVNYIGCSQPNIIFGLGQFPKQNGHNEQTRIYSVHVRRHEQQPSVKCVKQLGSTLQVSLVLYGLIPLTSSSCYSLRKTSIL